MISDNKQLTALDLGKKNKFYSILSLMLGIELILIIYITLILAPGFFVPFFRIFVPGFSVPFFASLCFNLFFRLTVLCYLLCICVVVFVSM